MLSGLGGTIDLIVPRGGKSLVARVQQEARVPVFSHLEGICHVYVDKSANPAMARDIVLNAKMRRTGVCGSAETILIDRAAAKTNLAPIIRTLIDAGCEIRGDAEAQAADPRVKPASEEDWSTEYLDSIVSLGVVNGVDEAMAHIAKYGSQHTDAIIADDEKTAQKISQRGRQRHCPAQCLHPVCRRRRIRLWRGNRHCHRQAPCPRARRLGATHNLQIPGAWFRANPSMMKPPLFGRGQRIGLFGGSFNPAHYGHYMVALYALKRLQLDWVWWLVSPQNPLKDPSETGEYDERLKLTKLVAKHPRFVVSDLERQANSHNTAETLLALNQTMKQANFIWIMGADSLANLHNWHNWTDIVEALPLASLARPGYSIRALGSRAALRYAASRVKTGEAAKLVTQMTPAWVFLPMPLRPESSTAIRNLNQPPRSSKQRGQNP